MSGKGDNSVEKTPDEDDQPGMSDTKPSTKKKSKGKVWDQRIKSYLQSLAQRPPRPVPKLDFKEKQKVEFIRSMTYNNVWYYRDRLSVPRGPCTMPVLRECWVQGVIDDTTLIWGQGLMDWLPIRNVRTLVPQIRTLEVQVATFLKKHLSLKPALAHMRKVRGDKRIQETNQVERMF